MEGGGNVYIVGGGSAVAHSQDDGGAFVGLQWGHRIMQQGTRQMDSPSLTGEKNRRSRRGTGAYPDRRGDSSSRLPNLAC